MSRYEPSVVIARKDNQLPQFVYNWYMVMPYLESNAYVEVNPIFGGIEGAVTISHRITAIDTPLAAYETTKNTVGSKAFHTAASNDIGTITMTIDEFEDGLSLEYITDWMRMTGELNGTGFSSDDPAYRHKSGGFYAPPALYKKNLILTRTTSSGDSTHFMVYEGCFPISMSNINHNYEDESIMSYSVTFATDKVTNIIQDVDLVRDVVESKQNYLTGRSDAPSSNWGDTLAKAGEFIAKAGAIGSMVAGRF